MADDKVVKVRLIAVADQYVKGTTEASTATRKLGSDIDKTSSNSKGFATSTGKATAALKGMAVAGAAVAGTALVSFLSDAVAAAGDLEQSIGGVDAVFKDSADKIHEFGKNAADAVGLSTNEFNQLATVTGALLKNSGLDDFTQSTIDLTQRAADVSALFGGTAKDAVEAFNAALKGESDPIEKYGVKLNEAAVQAELLRKGQDKLTGSALDQAKAQARIQIIMDQTADAAGRFAGEANTLQGQQQRLTKEWENAKTELGQFLLPVLTKVTDAMRGGVDGVVAAVHAWEEVPGPIQAAVGALIAWRIAQKPVTAGAGLMAERLRGIREEMALQKALAGGITGGYQRLGDEAQTTSKKVGGLRAGLAATSRSMGGLRGVGSSLMGLVGGPWGIAIVGLTAVIGKWMSANQEAAQRQRELTEAVKADSGAIGENTREKVKNSLESEGILKTAKELGVNLADVTDAALGNALAQERVNEQLAASKTLMAESAAGSINGGEAIADWQKKADSLTGALTGQNSELQNSIDAYKRTSEAGGDAADATKDVGDAASKAAPSVDRYAGVLKKIKDEAEKGKERNKELAAAMLEVKAAAGDADAAEIAYQRALDDATDSLKENGRTLDVHTEKGRQNKEALQDIGTQANAMAEANLKNGESVASVNKELAGAREALIQTAMKMGASRKAAEEMAAKYVLTRDEVDDLKTSMDKIPKEKVTDLKVKDAEAKKKIADLQALLTGDWLKDKTIHITTIYKELGSTAARMAAYDRDPRRSRAIEGYATGGYTGNISPKMIAGVVHGDEQVIQSPSRRKFEASNPGVLDYINKYGTLPPGYALGGRVIPNGALSRMPVRSAAMDMSALAGMLQSGAPTINVTAADPYEAARRVLDAWQWEVSQ